MSAFDFCNEIGKSMKPWKKKSNIKENSRFKLNVSAKSLVGNVKNAAKGR